MTDVHLVDAVILGGAADTDHHEISSTRALITKAEAMGAEDVVAPVGEPGARAAHAGRGQESVAAARDGARAAAA